MTPEEYQSNIFKEVVGYSTAFFRRIKLFHEIEIHPEKQ